MAALIAKPVNNSHVRSAGAGHIPAPAPLPFVARWFITVIVDSYSIRQIHHDKRDYFFPTRPTSPTSPTRPTADARNSPPFCNGCAHCKTILLFTGDSSPPENKLLWKKIGVRGKKKARAPLSFPEK